MKIDVRQIRDINAITDRDAKVLAAAVMYANNGFLVLPVRPGGKALPGKSYNFNYSHASRDARKVAQWFGIGGKYEGWNIGIATGKEDGAFVIDIDTHGDINGIDTFNSLVPDGYTYRGPIQSTPSGGKHLIHQWREYASSSTSKIGAGIDTRGGSADSCGGHIVVWPSIIGDVEYQWEQGGEVEPTPDWLMERMGRPLQKHGTGNRGNEYLTEGDIERKYSLDKIETMLDIVPPDELSYSEWLQVGQAIHSQHDSAEGLAIWDQWSRTGSRYKPGECSSRWVGFNSNGTIRIGTLIHYAKQRGYELIKTADVDPNKDETDALIEELNKKFAVVPMGTDVMIIEEVDVPLEVRRIQPRYRLFRKQGFKSLIENQFAMGVTKTGGYGKMPIADIWLAHENRRTYPSGIGLFPNRPQRYQGYYNVWGGFSVEPSPAPWNLLYDHIKNIICSGNEDLFEWVLQWCADLMQDPGNPKGCAIVMKGIEGCGKGTFVQMIGEVFGTGFKHITDEEHLVGRFNGHMMDCLVAFADEVTYGGNRKVAGKLKALVSERFITAERKGIDAIQYHNCAHLLVASNESWFIPAGPQSRRWLVLEVDGSKANNRAYFDAIHFQMEQEGGLGGMLHDLLQIKITRDLKKAPETDALNEQRAQYGFMDTNIAWWANQLSVGVISVNQLDADADRQVSWPRELAKVDIFNAYSEWCKDTRRRPTSPDRFFKQLKKFGFESVRFNRGGSRIYGYAVPKYADALIIARDQGVYVAEESQDED